MPCYHPLPAWKGRRPGENGRRPVAFRRSEGFADLPVQLPCGTCLGCRLGRAQEWALRCVHESQLHPFSSFVTLTYDESKVPKGGSLDPRDFVLFMKRLRKARSGKVRFFQCGEYGERTERPHHHALLFGVRFSDRELLHVHNGNSLYRSGELEALWGRGHCSVGDVSYESAGYVARYTLKKQAASSYGSRVPPYQTMSRRPGLGAGWYDRFKGDVFPEGVTVHEGRRMKPPRFYEERFRRECDAVRQGLDGTDFEAMKRQRSVESKVDPESSGGRLVVREAVRTHAVNLLLERRLS